MPKPIPARISRAQRRQKRQQSRYLLLAAAALGVLLFGAATFALVPPLQIRVMQVASEAPGLASSINVGAFNLGNAVGAALGGAVISSGLGYAAIPVAGGLLAASGLLLAWLGRPRTAVAEAC